MRPYITQGHCIKKKTRQAIFFPEAQEGVQQIKSYLFRLGIPLMNSCSHKYLWERRSQTWRFVLQCQRKKKTFQGKQKDDSEYWLYILVSLMNRSISDNRCLYSNSTVGALCILEHGFTHCQSASRPQYTWNAGVIWVFLFVLFRRVLFIPMQTRWRWFNQADLKSMFPAQSRHFPQGPL